MHLRIDWKIKFILLVIILSGLTYGWVVYFFLVHAIILAINGTRFYANILAVAALISMPVVFVGGFISYIIFLLGIGYASGQSAYSPHYVSVCVTMLTVIPLALSMVGIVPFQRFEHKLLQHRAGVTKLEKGILMFLRVFNHIVYFVIPNILETIREERHYRKWMATEVKTSSQSSGRRGIWEIKNKILTLKTGMIQLAVEGICASIQYIPLWAVEISRLSDKKRETSSGQAEKMS
jgi:hypothetical protein